MRSAEFDDIYFNLKNGLAETRYTFLDGSNLPARFVGRDRFTICETGFGTGLNILAAWNLFEVHAQSHQRLELISIEKFPLTAGQIREALWQFDELHPQLERLLACYPLRLRGFHRMNLTPRVTLTLIFDDVQAALPQLAAPVDAWFLDGFAPKKNPDMWQPALYEHMVRLSAPGATMATFSAVGDMRRALKSMGWSVRRLKGYGYKYHMTAAVFNGPGLTLQRLAGRVAVIGAGIAGLSAAWHLQREGYEVTVYDASAIASGASGNDIGIINPKLTAQPSPQAAYYTSAFAYARHMLRDLEGSAYHPCGSLHFQTDADKARRFSAYRDALGWHADHLQILDAAAASAVAGVRVDVPCLYYPDAATVSPRAVCTALARGVTVHENTPVPSPDALLAQGFDIVILANANGVGALTGLPVKPVRGQVTRLAVTPASRPLACILCYGGYFTPAQQVPGTSGLPDEPIHMCGATFQPWDEDPAARPADHARNLDLLVSAVPSLGDFTVQGGWTGFRAASRDRFPVVGPLADSGIGGGGAGVFVSAAHGSHGMISGLLAGAMVAAQVSGAVSPVGQDAINAVSPGRFSTTRFPSGRFSSDSNGSLPEMAAKSTLGVTE